MIKLLLSTYSRMMTYQRLPDHWESCPLNLLGTLSCWYSNRHLSMQKFAVGCQWLFQNLDRPFVFLLVSLLSLLAQLFSNHSRCWLISSKVVEAPQFFQSVYSWMLSWPSWASISNQSICSMDLKESQQYQCKHYQLAWWWVNTLNFQFLWVAATQ